MTIRALVERPDEERSEARLALGAEDWRRLDKVGQALVARYRGPLALVDRNGRAEPANEQGVELADALNGILRPQFITLLARASEAGVSHTDFLRLGEVRDDLAIDLLVVPLAESGADADGYLVLGRDARLNRNFREALIESRKRYIDMVRCSADFAWETDTNGVFAFVTMSGGLGYTPDRLVGRAARSLLDRRRPPPEPFPFESNAPTEEAEVWLRDAAGEPVCLLVSSVPVTGEGGIWIGTRGVCRDVTEARRLDEALARARAREKLLANIVTTIRDEVEPERLLQTAARSLVDGLDASACWIYRADPKGGLRLAAEYGDWPNPPALLEVNTVIDRMVNIGPGPEIDELNTLAAPTRYRNERNGAICIGRAGRRRWQDDDRNLLAGIANQLGIAFQQIDTQESLLALSRTDGLTGLLNRRAFVDQLHGRLAQAAQFGLIGALFCVDLDNFKPINDHFGHRRGDAALRTLSRVLRDSTGEMDLVGRLGGDEFVIWFDAVDAEEAAAKAAALVEASQVLSQYSEDLEKALAASIGVALFQPDRPEEIEELIARADRAMYEAKRLGKNRFSLAPAPDGADKPAMGDA